MKEQYSNPIQERKAYRRVLSRRIGVDKRYIQVNRCTYTADPKHRSKYQVVIDYECFNPELYL